jgi:hypothetical protein
MYQAVKTYTVDNYVNIKNTLYTNYEYWHLPQEGLMKDHWKIAFLYNFNKT